MEVINCSKLLKPLRYYDYLFPIAKAGSDHMVQVGGSLLILYYHYSTTAVLVTWPAGR